MQTKHAVYLGAGVLLLGIGFLIYREKSKTATGEWIKPVDGKLTSPVGARVDPVTGNKTQVHNGQDIAVPKGTAVKAPRRGIVNTTASSEAGGKQVVLVHDNGWFTGYAHLDQVLVKNGQTVSQGQVIAYSGNSGAHTTAPHLHFTMKDEKGNTLDPRKYVYKS